MKHLSYTLSLLMLFSLSAFAQEKTGDAVGNDINVRSDSTVMSQSLCTLSKGTRIVIAGEKFDWYKVLLPQSFKAYVATKYIDPIGPKKGKVNATTLNLRLSPAADAYVVGKAQINDVVTIIGKQGEWYKVSAYPFGAGWVNKKFIKIHKTSQEIDALIEQLSVNDLKIRENAKKQLIAKGPQIADDLELYANKDTDKPTVYGLITVLGELAKNDKERVKQLLKKIDASDLISAAIILDIAQNAVQAKTKLPYYHYAMQNKLDYQTVQTAKNYLYRVNSSLKTIN